MISGNHSWLATVAVAIVSLVGANSALAISVNPYRLTVADLQGMGNSTKNTNLSTIDQITVAPDGVHLDITWRVGQNSDPFSPGFGFQDFPRVGLTLFTNSENDFTGRDLTAYDGVKWIIMSDLDLQNAQPFVQTAPNWTFYEPSVGQPLPGDMSNAMALLDFTDNTQNFSGLLPANIVHPDGNGEIRVNSIGIQIVGPAGLAVGQSVQSSVWFKGVPEPATATMLLLGAIGAFGFVRRRS